MIKAGVVVGSLPSVPVHRKGATSAFTFDKLQLFGDIFLRDTSLISGPSACSKPMLLSGY